MKTTVEINKYDAIVVGGGHAGCEAALALARTGNKTLMLAINLDSIAFLACNPSIGGTAKGHLVCEIDALGGEIGINSDKTILQLRMLNLGKGPAVHSLRAQIDKIDYHSEMKKTLENEKNLTLIQGEVTEILTDQKIVTGVKTSLGEIFTARTVIICTGVYLKSKIIIGNYTENTGPNGYKCANQLSQSLKNLGFEIFRFKTGTPTRIDFDSVDTNKMSVQYGDENIQTFSFMTKKQPKNRAVCYLTYTNSKTHEIIHDNLDKTPVYSGLIEGTGPRYCPSIETKIVRFSDKERHQLFLEPESAHTKETYVQGLSTSMPIDLQKKILNSISGLENAKIMRYAYAIEYDAINSLQLLPTLEYKNISGLYCAGQINGTSGYEEAAAQGIVAGINANLFLKGKNPMILKRSDGYIGVLIDDLVTKGTDEPYRMMTSRVEYRLHLRQDNADLRLTEIGRKVGLVSDKRYMIFSKKIKMLEKAKKELKKFLPPTEELNKFLSSLGESTVTHGISAEQLLKRNSIDAELMQKQFGLFKEIKHDVLRLVTLQVKYEGYISRQLLQIEQSKKMESHSLPQNLKYTDIKGLRIEAQQKLSDIKPLSLGQASRISGVSPADISVLTVYLKSRKI